jgi:biotin-(acetyl-CoA carboxylase) ligase
VGVAARGRALRVGRVPAPHGGAGGGSGDGAAHRHGRRRDRRGPARRRGRARHAEDGRGGPARKLAGILAEGAVAGARLSAVVVGIGVNLRPSAYPPEVAARAVALETLAGRAIDGDGLLVALLVALRRRRDALRDAADAAALLEAWRAWSPSAVGARIRWQQQGQACEGVTNGIDDTGALRVRTAAGETRLVAGEVEWA